jgi:hypothetical protein
MFPEKIGQKNLAIMTQCQILLVKLFQIGGKPHQTSLFPAVPQPESMAQFVNAQLDQPFENHCQGRMRAVRVSPGPKRRNDRGRPV